MLYKGSSHPKTAHQKGQKMANALQGKRQKEAYICCCKQILSSFQLNLSFGFL